MDALEAKDPNVQREAGFSGAEQWIRELEDKVAREKMIRMEAQAEKGRRAEATKEIIAKQEGRTAEYCNSKRRSY